MTCTPRSLSLAAVLAVAGLATAGVSAASADTLQTAAPGARNGEH